MDGIRSSTEASERSTKNSYSTRHQARNVAWEVSWHGSVAAATFFSFITNPLASLGAVRAHRVRLQRAPLQVTPVLSHDDPLSLVEFPSFSRGLASDLSGQTTPCVTRDGPLERNLLSRNAFVVSCRISPSSLNPLGTGYLRASTEYRPVVTVGNSLLLWSHLLVERRSRRSSAVPQRACKEKSTTTSTNALPNRYILSNS